VTAAPPPPFHATVVPAPPAYTTSWHRGCPVARESLRLITMTYRGFDGRVREGRLVVSVRVARGVVKVFRTLYDSGYPIRRMVPIDAYANDDDRSLAADNTAAFNCRYAVASGPRRWSAHAYGLAVDVNPVENPYLEDGRVHPAGGRAYLDRGRARRGMALRGRPLVRAFREVGWAWGGRWTGSPDYQHFSATGG
jgi:hypothetical protein